MFSTVLSATLKGLHVEFIQVEADVSNGLPMFHLVGYLSSEVKEAGERVRTAIRNSGVMLPAKKMIVNLSPANIRKRGTIFDLPIAVAVLAAMGEIPMESLEGTLMVGELSLDGGVKRASGILPIVQAAKLAGCKKCIIPIENEQEGELVDGVEVIGVVCLEETLEILRGRKGNKKQKILCKNAVECEEKYPDFSDIKGQHLVKRAAEIAVAGGHNLLMVGPPGAGKTAIAKRLPGILPPLTKEESIELTTIYSVVDKINLNYPLVTRRPFREVHHTTTKTALLGGGLLPKPGEITLAHHGVLFLDEIAEFPRAVLETLRQPLEEHCIKIIRERGEYDFPADFLPIAAMNPCPCGNYPDLNKCSCTTGQIQNYMSKLSQPLLDRIDMCVEVSKVTYEALGNAGAEESSAKIRQRVERAREVQSKRYQQLPIKTNGHLDMRNIERFCELGIHEKKIMKSAYENLGLTARTYHKVLCVARTIADLDGQERVEVRHLREALSYRAMNMLSRRK